MWHVYFTWITYLCDQGLNKVQYGVECFHLRGLYYYQSISNDLTVLSPRIYTEIWSWH